MDFLEASLVNTKALSIHWTSDCNMACTYCYIKKDKKCMSDLNYKICQALKDGTFAENVKKHFNDTTRKQIETLSLWGAEPTINGQYFAQFINDMLDFFPNLTSMMFSTNSWVGGDKIYNDFIIPLLSYPRQLHITIQFSLDGPAWINDRSRKQGATENTIQSAYSILKRFPEKSNLTYSSHFKATLSTEVMQEMNDKGIPAFEEYYQFFQEIDEEAHKLYEGKENISVNYLSLPTLVDPGEHTPKDGKIFAQWLKNLQLIDRNKISRYQGPLFYQALLGVDMILSKEPNYLFKYNNSGSCSASNTEITIDYLGNIYTCERLCRQLAYNHMTPALESNTNMRTNDKKWLRKVYASQAFHNNFWARRRLADSTILLAAKMGDIDEKYFTNEDARTVLYCASMGMMCHIGIEEEHASNPFVFPFTYIYLLGNGAIDELIKISGGAR